MEERRVGDLVQAAAAGDRQAWDHVVDRFSGLLWSVAAGYRLSHADAADVFQTTWLKLLENLDRLRDPERVGAWLATTARHECQRALRRNDRGLPAAAAHRGRGLPPVRGGRRRAGHAHRQHRADPGTLPRAAAAKPGGQRYQRGGWRLMVMKPIPPRQLAQET